jgi:two-component system chemotaxis response regulator CheY
VLEPRLRALIVDDSNISRRILAKVVEKVFHFDEAENGLIAVAKFQDAIEAGSPYDIVFMDIIMPEMDGKEAVRKIREYEVSLGREESPIIMVSASEMLDEIKGLVNGLLRKPTSKPLLNEMLQKLFKGQIEPLC